ncbi:glycerol-3-phosphate dehydrogenase (NAD+) [Saitozyma sp. JCM 24511]|nr:glycerol-3-phosphate dehydrogenase (NAD+) [Saitozyma sp. JCM 24511]
MGKEKLAIIGSGNWYVHVAASPPRIIVDLPLRRDYVDIIRSRSFGIFRPPRAGLQGSAIARIAGNNVPRFADEFDQNISVWVYEEEFEGKKLTEIINTEHENKKYLPGVKLPENVVAIPDIGEAVKGATALVFVMPHQFLGRVIDQLSGKVQKGAKAISLIKGVDVKGADIHIFADVISDKLGVSCSALSGANIAPEVARDQFSETTIGYRSKEEGEMWKRLFETPSFRVSLVEDVAGVSLCGALKNIVAVAAGLVEGLGWGNNSQAAIMRIGLLEMHEFCLEFFEGVKAETFLMESSGVADVITSCLGGRNKRVAVAFVKEKKVSTTCRAQLRDHTAWSSSPFDELEQSMLNGQKLQGIHTAKEVHNFLKARNRVDAYPLFNNVYKVCWENYPVEKLTEGV